MAPPSAEICLTVSLPVSIETDNPQRTSIHEGEEIPRGMPRHDGAGAGRLEGVHRLARLDVVDLDAGALVAAADQVHAVPGEAEAADGPAHGGQRALAQQVGRVPQRDDRVAAARGQVLGDGRQLDAQARRRVARERELPGRRAGDVVVVRHGGPEVRVRQDAHLALAGGDEDGAAVPGEADLVGLDGLLETGPRRRGRRI